MSIVKILMFFSLFFSQGEKINTDEIIIKYVSYDLYTFQDISCKDFEDFSEKINTIIINNKNEIQKFCRIVKKIKTAHSNHPDVRVKIEFKHNKEIVKTICMDRFSLEIDGKTCRFSQKLFQYIEEIKKVNRKN